MDTIHWLNKNLEHTLMWIISIFQRIYSSIYKDLVLPEGTKTDFVSILRRREVKEKRNLTQSRGSYRPVFRTDRYLFLNNIATLHL